MKKKFKARKIAVTAAYRVNKDGSGLTLLREDSY